MVEFLAASDVEISLLTFHGFAEAGATYLAKQVEVLQKASTQSSKASKQTNLVALARKKQESGVKEFFDDVAASLRANLTNAYEWPNQTGYGYYFPDTTATGTPTTRSYLTLSIPNNPKGSLLLTLYDRTIQAASDRWPDIERSLLGRVAKKNGYAEIRLTSQQDWQALRPAVEKLLEAILLGRKANQERELAAERQTLDATIREMDDEPDEVQR